MNVAAIALELGHGRESWGVGREATLVRNSLREFWDSVTESESLGYPLRAVHAELEELLEECREANWDGYGAEPVNLGSYRKAKLFLGSLPVGEAPPEISVEPDGEVSLEWRSGRSSVLSLSFSDQNTITFAGLYRRGKINGQEFFVDEIPAPIILHLKRLFRGR